MRTAPRAGRLAKLGRGREVVAASLAFLLAGGLSGCGGGSGGGGTRSAADLRAELGKLTTPGGLTTVPQEAVDSSTDPKSDPPTCDATGATPRTYTVTNATYKLSGTYDTHVLLNPSTDVIYPGSVLVGSSIDDGSYREVVRGEKNDVVVSYGGLNGVYAKDGSPGIVSGTIHPSLSEFRKFHNRVMTQDIRNGASTRFTLQISNVSTEQSFDAHLKVGVSYKAPLVSASIKGHFDYAKETNTNKYVVRFAQTFYTVDVTQGQAGFLYKDFDVSTFEGFRPVYVSSVAFGRMGFVTLESSAARETIGAGLDAVLQTPTLLADAKGDTNVIAIQAATNLSITVVGTGEVVTTLEGFQDWLVNGGFGPGNTGQIVSYKLSFVDDGSLAQVVYNDSYPLRSVAESDGTWDVALLAMTLLFADVDSGGVVDLKGAFTVTAKNGTGTFVSGPQTLWDVEEAQSITFLDNGGITTLDEAHGGKGTVHVTATSLDDTLTFDAVNVHNHNDRSDYVYYDEASPPAYSLRHVLEQPKFGAASILLYQVPRADLSTDTKNRYAQFNLLVQATPVYPLTCPAPTGG